MSELRFDVAEELDQLAEHFLRRGVPVEAAIPLLTAALGQAVRLALPDLRQRLATLDNLRHVLEQHAQIAAQEPGINATH